MQCITGMFFPSMFEWQQPQKISSGIKVITDLLVRVMKGLAPGNKVDITLHDLEHSINSIKDDDGQSDLHCDFVQWSQERQ